MAGRTITDLTAINESGVVVGVAYTPNAGNDVPVYYWGTDQPSIIPGVPRGGATDVSESGWIVGYASFVNPFRIRAFIWRPGWPQARI
ncbi:MAG TPA: hypothetical protein VGQ52_08300, partial [Gemmatimonadaceae bacterium]|nr:hypothetical protein [Gemmatimonadaceae bacterium]